MINENVLFITLGFAYLFLNLINGNPIDILNILSLMLSISSATLVNNYLVTKIFKNYFLIFKQTMNKLIIRNIKYNGKFKKRKNLSFFQIPKEI